MVKFTARRSMPELVVPARPTPRETKILSDVDDCFDLRFYSSAIQFFRGRPGHPWPAKAIKTALAEALVYYYPITGRLREIPSTNRLVVDCTAEGVVFVEASADVRLEEFGQPLLPPYPCIEELLCDAADTQVVIGKPLFFIQVTQLTCGGFSVSFHACHSIVDGFGMIQFIKCIADLARGEALPTVLPVWERQILMARTPPCMNHIDPAYQPVLTGSEYNADAVAGDVMLSTSVESMVHKYLIFSPREIAHLRRHIPPSHLRKSVTSFELLTAVLWRCRTIALGYKADQQVRAVFTLNARGRWKCDLPIPRGYYGNALVYSIVEATAEDLCGNPLSHTLDMVCKAKNNMSVERMKSTVDMMASLRGRPTLPTQRVYWVSDISHLGDDKLDFGWAEWVTGAIPVPRAPSSFHTRLKNKDGEESVMVSILLPRPAMDRFAKEIASWLNKDEGAGNYLTLSSL